MVAAGRAAESAREEPLFVDPYAADFVAAGGMEEESIGTDAATREWDSFSSYLPVRTRFFDDYLLDATRTVRQVVIIAAGLDTRAFRLPITPEVTVYELDTPEMLAFKQQVLDARGAQPAGRRAPVPVDLREDWGSPLAAAGFEPSIPSAWLVEGLLSYLSPEHNDRLLSGISDRSAAGSRLSMEYLSVDAVALMATTVTGEFGTELQAMWRGGGVAEPAQPWLDRHGWDAETFDTYERAAAYHREMPPPGDPDLDRFADEARNGLVVARRR
ncbi:S-adenosyl-L-methionine-dependent methyltransferase [Nocardia jinanensis]|uniref:S-adenosyl-L-methionine-dependent methyltransferase n=2 Tax=Nocardia jinanensis TaxID=382504 RepID=A0A917RDF5_9NOCA|nr:S-adenosyl-L-methionine-dependent methyltransferase [Nocardia jinanensis]